MAAEKERYACQQLVKHVSSSKACQQLVTHVSSSKACQQLVTHVSSGAAYARAMTRPIERCKCKKNLRAPDLRSKGQATGIGDTDMHSHPRARREHKPTHSLVLMNGKGLRQHNNNSSLRPHTLAAHGLTHSQLTASYTSSLRPHTLAAYGLVH
jgi:hypothetical protein